MNISHVLFILITTKEGFKVEKHYLHDYYEQLYLNIEWWMNTIAYITVVGGFGNILTFIQRGFLKNVSVCFFISILALADTCKKNQY